MPGVLKLLPLQGDRLPPKTTQGAALGSEFLPLQGVLGTGLSLTAYHKRRASAASRRVGDRVISKSLGEGYVKVSNSYEQHAL